MLCPERHPWGAHQMLLKSADLPSIFTGFGSGRGGPAFDSVPAAALV
jgi:hypothetical protein